MLQFSSVAFRVRGNFRLKKAHFFSPTLLGKCNSRDWCHHRLDSFHSCSQKLNFSSFLHRFGEAVQRHSQFEKASSRRISTTTGICFSRRLGPGIIYSQSQVLQAVSVKTNKIWTCCGCYRSVANKGYVIKNSQRNFATGSFDRKGTAEKMDLKKVVEALKGFAPTSMAGSWDNVGLLIEPSPPHSVSKILLTNDLTPAVMKEAVDTGVNMIISYHPPIFAPLKRITQGSWKEKIAGICLERRIALYSPHTSWDAVKDGVNDWLIGAFDVTNVEPVEQTEATICGRNKQLTIRTSADNAQTLTQQILPSVNREITSYCDYLSNASGDGTAEVKVSIQSPASCVPAIVAALQTNDIPLQSLECHDLAKVPTVGYGMGRVGQLTSPVSVETAVAAVKSHLNLKHVRLAQAADKTEIKSVAVCAGSGSSVLGGAKADLYLTGEMSHHEVLDAVCKGTHVILCDHSNTERGFLKVMQGRLTETLEQKVEVLVSETDRDPLLVV